MRKGSYKVEAFAGAGTPTDEFMVQTLQENRGGERVFGAWDSQPYEEAGDKSRSGFWGVSSNDVSKICILSLNEATAVTTYTYLYDDYGNKIPIIVRGVDVGAIVTTIRYRQIQEINVAQYLP